MNSKINHTVEHLFRSEYGKVMAVMTNKYGITQLEKVEDAVQDAFLRAMQVWGYKQVPDNPTGWLIRVANNTLIDKLRRNKKIEYSDNPFLYDQGVSANEMALKNEITDSQLKMIFACCHPSLTQEHQIVLSLKLIGGFSNKELAEALLKKEETVAKSFTRAKKKFKSEVQMLSTPIEMGLQSRLFVVLRVIYLLFTEGYAASSGSQVLKRDICYEALRLALLLKENKYCQHPNLKALIALMCFHASRFDARLDAQGNLVTLEFQDREKYNKELIEIGIRHFEHANSKGQPPSNYHLEAAVSYYHCAANSFEETDWENILGMYDLQLKTQYSPMRALNRIVPYSKVHGVEKALGALSELQKTSDYSAIGLFYAIKAELLAESDKPYETELQKAIDLTDNDLMKRHLEKKLARK